MTTKMEFFFFNQRLDPLHFECKLKKVKESWVNRRKASPLPGETLLWYISPGTPNKGTPTFFIFSSSIPKPPGSHIPVLEAPVGGQRGWLRNQVPEVRAGEAPQSVKWWQYWCFQLLTLFFSAPKEGRDARWTHRCSPTWWDLFLHFLRFTGESHRWNCYTCFLHICYGFLHELTTTSLDKS